MFTHIRVEVYSQGRYRFSKTFQNTYLAMEYARIVRAYSLDHALLVY